VRPEAAICYRAGRVLLRETGPQAARTSRGPRCVVPRAKTAVNAAAPDCGILLDKTP
jgi:hypothetical protein